MTFYIVKPVRGKKDVVLGEKQMKNVRQRMPEFPVVTGIIVTLIYIFVIVFGEIASIILSKSILDNNAVLTQLARFLILLILNCLMWFLFVPKILLLPSPFEWGNPKFLTSSPILSNTRVPITILCGKLILCELIMLIPQNINIIDPNKNEIKPIIIANF